MQFTAAITKITLSTRPAAPNRKEITKDLNSWRYQDKKMFWLRLLFVLLSAPNIFHFERIGNTLWIVYKYSPSERIICANNRLCEGLKYDMLVDKSKTLRKVTTELMNDLPQYVTQETLKHNDSRSICQMEKSHAMPLTVNGTNNILNFFPDWFEQSNQRWHTLNILYDWCPSGEVSGFQNIGKLHSHYLGRSSWTKPRYGLFVYRNKAVASHGTTCSYHLNVSYDRGNRGNMVIGCEMTSVEFLQFDFCLQNFSLHPTSVSIGVVQMAASRLLRW